MDPWSHVVLGVYKKSILDHAYCTNPELINNNYNRMITFGNHRLVVLSISSKIPIIKPVTRRDWRGYSVGKLNENYFYLHGSMTLIKFMIIGICLRGAFPLLNAIKNKLNVCKRLFHSIRLNPSEVTKTRIKNLNAEEKKLLYKKQEWQ
jgi:hypothetical protein